MWAVIGRSDEMFVWQENTGWIRNVRTPTSDCGSPDGAVSDTGFSTADLDGDGDLDLITAFLWGTSVGRHDCLV